MEQIRVGIIGFGFMGTTHFGIYNENTKAVVAAIADVDPQKRQGNISAVVGNIGGGDNSKPVDLNNIKVYSDGMELINDPQIDLIDICVPVYLHKQYAMAAIAAGKHVMCEKPLARNSSDAQEIINAAEKSGRVFMTGMCIRFWPEYEHTYRTIKSGAAGKLYSATFKRLSPDIDGSGWENWFMKSKLSGGAIFDLHLHDADFIRHLFGMPQAVTAFGARGVRSDTGIDHVMAIYDYGDEALVTAEGGWDATGGTPFEMSFQIVCENMTFRFSETGYKVIHANGTVEEPVITDAALPTGWHREIDCLLNCILERKENDPRMDLNNVVEAIRIVEAEIASVDSGKKEIIK